MYEDLEGIPVVDRTLVARQQNAGSAALLAEFMR
jgi:hypothetical protein